MMMMMMKTRRRKKRRAAEVVLKDQKLKLVTSQRNAVSCCSEILKASFTVALSLILLSLCELDRETR